MNHNRSKLLLAPLAASALVFSLAACGSDSSSSSNTTAPAATTEMAPDSSTMASGSTAGDMGDSMAGSDVTVGDITVSDAWVRQPAEGQTNSAAYATIANAGDADVQLVGATVNVDATVEIHETTTDADGKMSMNEVPDGFAVPAGGTFELKPGGAHIMLIGIDPTQITGSVELTLEFDDGTEVVIPAEVRGVDATGDIGSTDHSMTGTTVTGG